MVMAGGPAAAAAISRYRQPRSTDSMRGANSSQPIRATGRVIGSKASSIAGIVSDQPGPVTRPRPPAATISGGLETTEKPGALARLASPGVEKN